jgi:Protein of unknown function (DUF3313)
MHKELHRHGASKVLLDPVTIWTAPDSQLINVPQNQRQAAADRFHADLYKALSKRCQMVTSPSPGTLRLGIALTDATTPNAAVNTVATYTPYVSTGCGLASLAFNNGVGYFAGTAAAEGYATDAITGTLLWEAVDKRGGTTAVARIHSILGSMSTTLLRPGRNSSPLDCRSLAHAGSEPD